jgi:hypothetical protein
MLRLLPSLLLVGIPAIIAGQVEYGRLPLRGPDRCLTRCLSTSHYYPCRRGAVPAQSCINPAACRSRVFTELLVRCTTMVRPRKDYSMTATATVRLPSATTRATTKLLRRWQMLLACATDGRMKRLEHLLRPRSGHSSQDGSGETSTVLWSVESPWLHRRRECSSAHACSGSSNQGTADYCSGRLRQAANNRAQSINNSPALAPGTRQSNWHRASPTL